MFLIILLPSMWEAVGSGDHMMAAVMVRTADALWDAYSGHDPLVAAAMTQRSRSQTPAGGKRSDKRASSARSKSCPSSSQDFYSYHNPGNGMCKYHNYYGARDHKCMNPCSWSENYHPVVTEKFKKNIFFHLDNISHPEKLVSQHLVSSRHVWCSLAKDVAA
jgi:hypothetical protein